MLKKTKEKRSRFPPLLLALLGHSSVTDTTRTARLHHSPKGRKGLASPGYGFDPCILPYGWLCASSSIQGLIPGSFWVRRGTNKWQQVSSCPTDQGITPSPKRFPYSSEHSQRASGAARSPACRNTRLSNLRPSRAQQPQL